MPKNITILVVEDILSARETIIHILKALGFSSFLEADNGAMALEKLEKHKVELIISDWNMPQMNGLNFLKNLRSSEKYSSTPFIFVTSKSEVEDIALASDFGVSGYLIKPVTIAALDTCLAQVFASQSSFEEDLLIAQKKFTNSGQNIDLNQVENVFHSLAEKYPQQRPRIFLVMAKIFMTAQAFDRAEPLLLEILSTNALFAKAWTMMARLKSWQGEWSEALLAVDKALEISPNNSQYHVLKGSIYLHVQDFFAAQKAFMTALNIDRKNDQIKQDIWNIYLDLDMVHEVQRDFGSYIFSALTCDTLNNMAVAYRRQGELALALEVYRAALEKEPDNPKILFNAAVAYVNRNQYTKAKALLEHALGNDPQFEKAHDLLKQIDKTLTGASSPKG